MDIMSERYHKAGPALQPVVGSGNRENQRRASCLIDRTRTCRMMFVHVLPFVYTLWPTFPVMFSLSGLWVGCPAIPEGAV